MITTYEFPNQWNWRIFLSICNDGENVNDVIVHLNDKENATFKEESVNVKTIEAPCFVCDPMNLIRNNLYK
jgi:hypothetical protein